MDDIFFTFLLEGPKKRKTDDKEHQIAHQNILDLSNTSLFSFKTENDYVDNGLCIRGNSRYQSQEPEKKKIKCEVKMQTLLGDIISSIHILSQENKELKENYSKALEKVEALENNLTILRNRANSLK